MGLVLGRIPIGEWVAVGWGYVASPVGEVADAYSTGRRSRSTAAHIVSSPSRRTTDLRMAALSIRSVLISDAVDKSCAETLASAGMRVVCKQGLSPDQLVQELKGHDALIVRSETKVTASILCSAPQLQVVGRAGTGVDNVDLEAATKRGVIVMNTPGGNSTSACELTCALICSLARHLPQAVASLKGCKWQRKAFSGTELWGKTLAILGLGRIGREVALRMQAFGMKTVGFDPIVSLELAKSLGVQKMELKEIWEVADYITIHTPLIPQTKNLINSMTLGMCRRGVKIVNVARGGIVDEVALLEALESGQVGGAALDVFLNEPPNFEEGQVKSLLEHPNVICTPHLGASTKEAQQRVAAEIAEQIVQLAKGGTVTGVVNAPLLSASMSSENAPWIATARALGRIALALIHSEVGKKVALCSASINITVEGARLSTIAELIRGGVIMGILSGGGFPEANLVSARNLAETEGLKASVQAVKDSMEEVIQITASLKGSETYNIVGGVHGDGVPRLLSLNKCPVAKEEGGFALRGCCLIFKSPSLSPSAALGPLLTSLWGLGVAVSCAAPIGKESQGFIALRAANANFDGMSIQTPGFQLILNELFI